MKEVKLVSITRGDGFEQLRLRFIDTLKEITMIIINRNLLGRYQVGTNYWYSPAVPMVIVAAMLALCGCSVFGPATPTTTMKATIGGQEFNWSCPKQFNASNLVFRVSTNGTAAVEVGSISSVNDPLVIDKSYAGQIMLVKQWGDTGTQLINAGGNLAMKAMSAAPPTNAPIPIVITNAVAPPAK